MDLKDIKELNNMLLEFNESNIEDKIKEFPVKEMKTIKDLSKIFKELFKNYSKNYGIRLVICAIFKANKEIS